MTGLNQLIEALQNRGWWETDDFNQEQLWTVGNLEGVVIRDHSRQKAWEKALFAEVDMLDVVKQNEQVLHQDLEKIREEYLEAYAEREIDHELSYSRLLKKSMEMLDDLG